MKQQVVETDLEFLVFADVPDLRGLSCFAAQSSRSCKRNMPRLSAQALCLHQTGDVRHYLVGELCAIYGFLRPAIYRLASMNRTHQEIQI